MKKRLIALLLAPVLLLGLAGGVQAAQPEAAAEDAARSLAQAVPEPQLATTDGDWTVIALARSGFGAGEGYFDSYLSGVEETLRQRGGALHERKYTEYARLVLALTALGRDARDVAGYDLTLPLADFDKVLRQGVNGPIWALLALDSARYPMPENPQAATQATRQRYVDAILARQLEDGGWSLSDDGSAEADLTAMALQALAPYRGQSAVTQAVDRALGCLASLQDDQGGFSSQGQANAESCAQVVLALATLGVGQDDPRFVKDGGGALDALLSYYTPGQGFSHTADSGPSLMTTQQGLCALAAVHRSAGGQAGLYDMTDVLTLKCPPMDQSAAAWAVRAALRAAWCCLLAI